MRLRKKRHQEFDWYKLQQRKKDRRQFRWGIILFSMGFLLNILLIQFTEYGQMLINSASLGPFVLLMAVPLLFGSPVGILSCLMIIFGLGLLIKLSIRKLKKYFKI
ncbi:MAG: hypothetical protein WC346_04455 [Methanogenium sp.]|jgi:nitrate reductase gamma subunit